MQNAELSSVTEIGKSARSKAPVFVVGCPRSGTTLLYHMLLSAGNFAIYRAESQVFNILEPRFGDLNSTANKRKLLKAWYETALFTKTGLNATEIEKAVMDECRNGGDFLRIVMEAMSRRQNVERWADSTPEHLLYLDRIKATISNALAIHIIRDGRDVALSLEKQAWIQPFFWDRTKSLEVAALYWDWIVMEGRKRGRALGSDYVEVHYEDLVQNPRELLAKLGRFIEQELDYERIERVGVGSVSRPNTSFEADGENGFAPVARWKNTLSAQQLATLETLIGKTLAEVGYSLQNQNGQSASPVLNSMRSIYRKYFDLKLRLKKETSLGKIFASRDLSWA